MSLGHRALTGTHAVAVNVGPSGPVLTTAYVEAAADRLEPPAHPVQALTARLATRP